MSNALTALTDHYDRLRNQTFPVPGVTKSDGKPLVIHFDPPTNAQAQRIRKQAGTTDEAQITLWTVIFLAKDENGKRMFDETAETIQALTENVPGRVLASISNAIMRFSPETKLGN
ncbi:hypothetical protein [Falsiruegeria litorea]|uniref:hypothetical protein n=1 Tax=Falsiruegeria litorea TaxID=1280831 RepID=UPI001BFDCA21|nr:hypothetical protein [Falsiruegeria litorea]MBT8169874.1 hypothetical protein [Falsiruegeria litorea]